MTILSAALAEGRSVLPAGEARLLLRHLLGCDAAYLVAHGEDSLAAEQLGRYRDLVERRAAGTPVAYLTGTREFFGRPFCVTPDVLIPRPETELLVAAAVAGLSGIVRPRVLDLGTGSGCIAVTLALELGAADVSASDVCLHALRVARGNAARLGAAVRFIRGDWLAAFGAMRFDMIVANPPYVPSTDPHLGEGDLRFEPNRALDGGGEGLDALRAIIGSAATRLHPGGSLLLEHGYDQSGQVLEMLRRAGYKDIHQQRDLAGIVRISGGRAPA